MKLSAQPVPLNTATTTSERRPIKQGALAAFRALRVGLEQAKTVPSILQQAAIDIHEAWEESSRPNK